MLLNRSQEKSTEQAILQIMWERGEATPQHVHVALSTHESRIYYTDVFRIMQIMTKKGLLECDTRSQRNYVYQPVERRTAVRS